MIEIWYHIGQWVRILDHHGLITLVSYIFVHRVKTYETNKKHLCLSCE
jgi:hypothetical protein